MATDILKNTSASEDALDAANVLCNGGSLRCYTGTKPTTCSDPITGQTQTAIFTLNTPAFNAAGPDTARALATMAGLPKSDTSTVAGNPVTFWRIFDSAGTTCIYQGDVSTTAAGTGSLQFDSVDFQAGGTATINDPFNIYLDD